MKPIKEITMIFQLPSYQSAIFLRMVVFKKLEYFKFGSRELNLTKNDEKVACKY